MKKIIGKILKRILPLRLYKLIANGFIVVPAYYKEILRDLEKYHTLSLNDSVEKKMMLLRKYAHIIDKGLHRVDAEPGHSATIAIELQNLVQELSITVVAKDPSYIWAKEKLDKYKILQIHPEEYTPFFGRPQKNIIDYELFFDFIKSRRSNRHFRSITISDEEWEKIEQLGKWAPSSCNKQPVKAFTTLNPQIAKQCLECCDGGTGFSEFIPAFTAIAVQTQAYVLPMEYSLPFIDGALAAQNMILGANSLGITGCFLTWAQKTPPKEARLRELLKIPPEYQIILNLAFGRAASTSMTPERKQL